MTAATSHDHIRSLQASNDRIDWQQVLEEIISSFECSTGTLHFWDEDSKLLKLEAYKGIPEFLLPKMMEIPIGKGMAGIAAERRVPVEMCNLQTDTSGIARPAAKETKVEGSIAAPLLLDGVLYGTLGIAKPIPYDFLEKEKEALMKIGAEISQRIRQKEGIWYRIDLGGEDIAVVLRGGNLLS